MRILSFALPFAVAVGLTAAPASAYLASNGLVVQPQGDGFYVPYRGKSGARAFWCAAGEYAQKQLGLSPSVTIFRTSEPPRRSGEGIAFSLSPGQAASKTGLATFGTRGGGISINHARSLCDESPFLFR
ncbi:hypothetical protein [Oceaniglobus ichthyenteri]|uniref:hypothetical protein n=1 Tax=Oceaniglobus ichthyenteri TaxID=2136177 RepID=UPI000D366EFF|nr:hypothetical protein [Oceaniglobus ichthyenteri]